MLVNHLADLDFYKERWHTARKEHRCLECAQPIKLGDRYQVIALKTWDNFMCIKTCQSCAEIRKERNLPLGDLREERICNEREVCQGAPGAH